jgi:hypothetical protein
MVWFQLPRLMRIGVLQLLAAREASIHLQEYDLSS